MPENVPAVDGPRILLIGVEGAGKSSLLGALAQAAQTQRQLLGSELVDVTGALAELQKRTYDKQVETQEEVAPYHVSLQGEAAVPATLLDCNGHMAREYLEGKRSMDDRALLSEAIAEADAFLKRKDLAKNVPRVTNMKLRDLYEFPSVNRLRQDFDAVRLRVDQIRGGLTDS